MQLYYAGIIIALLLSLYNQQIVIDQVCTCAQLLSKEDCILAVKQCTWDDIEGCSGIPCDSFTTDQECIDFTGCAINNNGICSSFTQCYDYIVNKTDNCQDVFPTCVNPDEVDENSDIHCQDSTQTSNYVICSEIKDHTLCNQTLSQADGNQCDWVDESCMPFDYTHCSAILTQTVCQSNDCLWNSNNSCQQPLCSNQSEINCTYIRGDQLGTYQICAYVDNTCNDPEDLTFLNQSTCLVNSGYTATWNGTQCLFCSQESYESLLYMTLLFYV